MDTRDDSASCSSSVTDLDQAHEYYEEVDNHTLDFRKRKAPTPIPIKSVVKELPPVVDPIQKFNEQLNRQFRPDLVPPSPSPPPILSEPIIKRALSPDPVIFDSHAKPIKPSKKNKEPSVSIKQKLFNRIHQLGQPTTKSVSFSELGMSYQQSSIDGFQVPPGMMLVPAPQQQHPTISQYKPPTLTYNNSFKNNKVAPPPSVYNSQTNNQSFPNNSIRSPSSIISTNHLIQSSYTLNHQQQQQQHNLFKHIDESKSSKKKHRKQSIDTLTDAKNTNRSFALYNQKNGRIEGIVKNRLNVATDDTEESRIVDEETEPKGKLSLWLSQPLCLGLTRLNGGILFGSMILLGCASFAGLVASIVLYTQDSVTDSQWKILGMVVCAIMLITIITTLSVFLCCYKHGYVFDKDDDMDANDPSTTQDAEGNERQKAVLRKIYKFNRPNDSPSIPSNMPHHVSTSPPPKPQPAVHVNDKQTNTETTISVSRPADFDRGVWPSINAYGGISYRSLIPPQMVSRFIQVLPHEIEQTMQPQQIIYQVVAPTSAIPPQQMQPRIIQIPAQQPSVVEYIETTQKQQPRTIQIPAQQPPIIEYIETTQKQQPRTIQIPAQQPPVIEYIETTQKQQPRTIQIPAQQPPLVEYVETTQNQQPRTIQISAQQAPLVEYVEATQKQPRTTIIRQPQTQQIVMQPTTRIEYVDVEDQRGRRIIQQSQYVDVEDQRGRRIIQQPQYVDVEDQRGRRIVQQPQYVDVEDQRGRRVVQQPQYEIVEEFTDRSIASSPVEEIVEIVDAPKHVRQRGRKKGKKHGFAKVSVKHLKAANEEPRVIVEKYKPNHFYA